VFFLLFFSGNTLAFPRFRAGKATSALPLKDGEKRNSSAFAAREADELCFSADFRRQHFSFSCFRARKATSALLLKNGEKRKPSELALFGSTRRTCAASRARWRATVPGPELFTSASPGDPAGCGGSNYAWQQFCGQSVDSGRS
jgi:hypothetical protein